MALNRDQKINTFVAIVTVGFGLSAMYYYVRAFLYGRGFPDNTFLPVLSFGDFDWLTTQWHQSHFAGVGYGHVYFPAAYLVIAPFSSLAWNAISPHRMWAIGLFEMLVTGFVFLLSWTHLRASSFPESVTRAFVSTFMVYPVLFTMVTGNFEGLLFISLALFIIFYHAGRTSLSLPFLGFCIAMKLFPAVFLVLLAADRNYRAIFHAVLWAALFTLVPLLLFPGGLRDGLLPWYENMRASQQMYFELMVVKLPGNHFGHSLLNGARVLLGQTEPLTASFLRGYMIFSVVCFAGVAWYVVKWEAIFWKRVALLVCAMCLLPYTSTDYKLLHFYMPLYLFINCERADKQSLLYIILFGLLMIPKGYLKFYHLDFYNTNVIFNTGAMLVMAGTIIVTGLHNRMVVPVFERNGA